MDFEKDDPSLRLASFASVGSIGGTGRPRRERSALIASSLVICGEQNWYFTICFPAPSWYKSIDFTLRVKLRMRSESPWSGRNIYHRAQLFGKIRKRRLQQKPIKLFWSEGFREIAKQRDSHFQRRRSSSRIIFPVAGYRLHRQVTPGKMQLLGSVRRLTLNLDRRLKIWGNRVPSIYRGGWRSRSRKRIKMKEAISRSGGGARPLELAIWIFRPATLLSPSR